MFAVHNTLWEQEIAKMERGKEREGRARWLFMDVWDQALQRPDAHTEPGTDCLHCESLRWFFRFVGTDDCGIGNLPGIFEQWTHQIYHVLFLEQERKKARAAIGA